MSNCGLLFLSINFSAAEELFISLQTGSVKILSFHFIIPFAASPADDRRDCGLPASNRLRSHILRKNVCVYYNRIISIYISYSYSYFAII